jgi:hypothetical protein
MPAKKKHIIIHYPKRKTFSPKNLIQANFFFYKIKALSMMTTPASSTEIFTLPTTSQSPPFNSIPLVNTTFTVEMPLTVTTTTELATSSTLQTPATQTFETATSLSPEQPLPQTTTPLFNTPPALIGASILSEEVAHLHSENKNLKQTVLRLSGIIELMQSKVEKLAQALTSGRNDIESVKNSFESHLVSIDSRITSATSLADELKSTVASQSALVDQKLATLNATLLTFKDDNELVNADTLAIAHASLQRQISRMNATIVRLTSTVANQNETVLVTSLKPQRVIFNKGFWKMRFTISQPSFSQQLSARFSTPYKQTPTVIYSVKSNVMFYGRPFVYKIGQETITNEEIFTTIEFFGPSQMSEVVLEYTAFGY